MKFLYTVSSRPVFLCKNKYMLSKTDEEVTDYLQLLWGEEKLRTKFDIHKFSEQLLL
jgi:hypothetical protein